MDFLKSWYLRTWGATLLVVVFSISACYFTPDWISRVGIVILTVAIAFDAHRRAVSQYLHPWLFLLLALSGLGLMNLVISPVVATGALIAGGVATLLTVPYKISNKKPSRIHLLVAIVFAQAVLLSSLISGTPVIQAAISVVPVLAIEELLHRPASEQWRTAIFFAILTLILLIALIIRASFTLS
ncbi:MAG TPA: hypothetical protein VLA04_04175 [Verrucomicrobiae bacterium]|nr:hypothetical protein [Verrucomicrobiae bacterium]